MWSKGINHWKIPLYENKEMIEHFQNLINAEMITERLFGDPLRRDHMNFLYSVIKIIDDSDDMVKKNMLNKDKNSIDLAIPKLTIYK